MRTHHKVIIGILVLAGATASIGGFLYTSRIANAYDLTDIIIEPAEPNPSPEPFVRTVDDRIAGLKDRGDGARLVAEEAENETFLRLAFGDNGTLIVSATSTAEDEETYAILALSLDGGRATVEESDAYLSTSTHRPTHLNVGTTCFSAEDGGGVVDVWCKKRGETEATRLTEHDGREALTEPAISPSGDWAAFQVDDRSSKDTKGSTVWKIGMNRSGITQLTRGADDRYPTWSGDEKSLFFQRSVGGSSEGDGGNWDIYRMTSSGANPEPILRTYDEDEMWPTEIDERRILLASGPRGEGSRLRILDIASKASVWPTSGAYGSETQPSLSPDGRLISFLAPVDPSEPDRLGIWVVELSE